MEYWKTHKVIVMMVMKGYNCYDDDDDEHDDDDDDDDDSEQVLGMFIGSVPTVQLQDFKMAKDLFNRPSIAIIIHLLIIIVIIIIMINDMFREEWCGRGQGFMTQYLRSDSGRNRASSHRHQNCRRSQNHYCHHRTDHES